MSLFDDEGHIVIHCVDCNKELIKIKFGETQLRGGFTVRCLTCEEFSHRPHKGGWG